jgi:hypothetical protein
MTFLTLLNIGKLMFSWCLQYWKPILAALLLVASFFFGFYQSKNHWQAPLLKTIQKYEADQAAYNKKLDDISNNVKANLEGIKKDIADKDLQIDSLSAMYESEKNKAPRKIFIVKDPRDSSKNVTIEFNKDGNQVCNRFSDTYLDTLNSMIKEANK